MRLISRDGRTTTITIEPDLYATDDDQDPLADLAAGFDAEEILGSAEPARLPGH